MSRKAGGVNLHDLAEAAEEGRNPGGVDVLRLETRGGGHGADTRTANDAIVLLFAEKVNARVLVEERLHAHGFILLGTRGEAEIHSPHRGSSKRASEWMRELKVSGSPRLKLLLFFSCGYRIKLKSPQMSHGPAIEGRSPFISSTKAAVNA
jgi:hypothetical protein